MNIRDRIPVCPHGTREDIDFFLVSALDRLESFLNKELTYTSGYRCPVCNKEAGGVGNSSHIRGMAVDIACNDSTTRYDIIALSFMLGFQRIGIGVNIIHLDVDHSLPQEVIWIYK